MKHGHLYQCGLELMNCTASIPSHSLPNRILNAVQMQKEMCCHVANVAGKTT